MAAIKNLLHTLHFEVLPTACINTLLAAGFCERGLQAGAVACEAKDVRLMAACKLPEKTCRLMDTGI